MWAWLGKAIAAVGYHGDREARAQGSLQPAKGSCWELEENHVTVMRQQGSLGFWRILSCL